MQTFTVSFYTIADWAETRVSAETPEAALKSARRLADEDLGALDLASYDETTGVDHIEVFDATGRPVADWQRADRLVRLAAPALLEAATQALVALNTAPRFRVAGLGDSYAIAATCDRAIAKARGDE